MESLTASTAMLFYHTPTAVRNANKMAALAQPRSAPWFLRLLLKHWRKRQFHTSRPSKARLVEVGKFDTPKQEGQYEIGQFFIHRVFGYRGAILFRWLADVYDRDIPSNSATEDKPDKEDFMLDQIKKLQAEKRLYYQALIDHRDFPFIRTQPEAITFLGSGSSASVYSLPGLDYVSHDDVLPYTNTSSDVFQHELFGQFFTPTLNQTKDPFLAPRDVLFSWRDQNKQCLALTDVHIETTGGIRVTVMPFYMGCREVQQAKVHWWRYNIRLENFTSDRVQLRERHWRIYGSTGTLETVKGRGVIGQEPVLSSRNPAFQYSSHVSLQSPGGYMWGTFRMERQDGKTFDIRVPPFTLYRHEGSKT